MDSNTIAPVTANSAYAGNSTEYPENSEVQEAAMLKDATAWIPKQPLRAGLRMETLEKPVVIPRVDIRSPLQVPMPFMRAYSPPLRLHDVEVHDFLAFIDNLAVVQAAPAPLQLLDVTGIGLGLVPYHWAQAAGLGVRVVAGAATTAITKSRSKSFLETVNADYFSPRGLKVRVCKDSEMAAAIGYPNSLPDLAPLDDEMMPPRDRRMEALAPYVSPLSFDVPSPTPQRDALDKIIARQIQSTRERQEKKQGKQQAKLKEKTEKKLEKRLRKNGGSDGLESTLPRLEERMSELDDKIRAINLKADEKIIAKKHSKATKIEEKRNKDIAKVEQDRMKLEAVLKQEPQTESLDKESKESKKVARMEYIVIEAL